MLDLVDPLLVFGCLFLIEPAFCQFQQLHVFQLFVTQLSIAIFVFDLVASHNGDELLSLHLLLELLEIQVLINKYLIALHRLVFKRHNFGPAIVNTVIAIRQSLVELLLLCLYLLAVVWDHFQRRRAMPKDIAICL